jgi:hypothetical protein
MKSFLSDPTYELDEKNTKILNQVDSTMKNKYFEMILRATHPKINIKKDIVTTIFCNEKDYENISKVSNILRLKKHSDFNVIIDSNVHSNQFNFDSIKIPKNTKEVAAEILCCEYLRLFPCSTTFQIIENKNENDEKKFKKLIMIENIEFENKKKILKLVFEYLEKLAIEMNSHYNFNFNFKRDLQDFFEIIVENAVECVAHEPGDKVKFSQEEHEFSKIITCSNMVILENLASEEDENLQPTKCENKNLGEAKILKKDTYFATVSSGLCIENGIETLSNKKNITNGIEYGIALPGHKISNTAKMLKDNTTVDVDYTFKASAYPGYSELEQSYKIHYDANNLRKVNQNDSDLTKDYFEEKKAISDVSIFEFKNSCTIKESFKTLSNDYEDKKKQEIITDIALPYLSFKETCLVEVFYNIITADNFKTKKIGKLQITGYGHRCFVIEKEFVYEILYIAEKIDIKVSDNNVFVKNKNNNRNKYNNSNRNNININENFNNTNNNKNKTKNTNSRNTNSNNKASSNNNNNFISSFFKYNNKSGITDNNINIINNNTNNISNGNFKRNFIFGDSTTRFSSYNNKNNNNNNNNKKNSFISSIFNGYDYISDSTDNNNNNNSIKMSSSNNNELISGDSGAPMFSNDNNNVQPILHSFFKGKFEFTDKNENEKTKTYYELSPANLVLKQIEHLLGKKCFFCSFENNMIR